jgi:hypothetical protein
MTGSLFPNYPGNTTRLEFISSCERFWTGNQLGSEKGWQPQGRPGHTCSSEKMQFDTELNEQGIAWRRLFLVACTIFPFSIDVNGNLFSSVTAQP